MNASYESLYRQHNATDNDIPFLTVSDTAEYLGVSKSKIYKDIRDGKLIAERSLDEKTMISPRALQRAYPALDIADLLDLEPIDTDTSDQSKPHGVSSTHHQSKPSKPARPALSSLELALQKRSGDEKPAANNADDVTTSNNPAENAGVKDDIVVFDKQQDLPEKYEERGKSRIFELFAALIASSAILFVLLLKI